MVFNPAGNDSLQAAERPLTVPKGWLKGSSCEVQANSENSVNYVFICNRMMADPNRKTNA